ncbi:MAG: hypothetical protein GY730_01505, partial [bacterium]|nr:hypothetical protein [bacterium]
KNIKNKTKAAIVTITLPGMLVPTLYYHKLIRVRESFLIKNLLAKTFTLIKKFFIYVNFGIFAFFFRKKKKWFDLAFVAGLFFTALPGLLVVPYGIYLTGYTSFCVLYGIYNINPALEQVLLNKIKTKLVHCQKT